MRKVLRSSGNTMDAPGPTLGYGLSRNAEEAEEREGGFTHYMKSTLSLAHAHIPKLAHACLPQTDSIRRALAAWTISASSGTAALCVGQKRLGWFAVPMPLASQPSSFRPSSTSCLLPHPPPTTTCTQRPAEACRGRRPDLSPKPQRAEVNLGLPLLNCSNRQSIFMM